MQPEFQNINGFMMSGTVLRCIAVISFLYTKLFINVTDASVLLANCYWVNCLVRPGTVSTGNRICLQMKCFCDAGPWCLMQAGTYKMTTNPDISASSERDLVRKFQDCWKGIASSKREEISWTYFVESWNDSSGFFTNFIMGFFTNFIMGSIQRGEATSWSRGRSQ